MRDELLNYYERELTFLRQMGAEFADKYPKIARRLLLEPTQCEDPHVERMIEAFAFLAARVHLKIDDEFPEITEALLGVIYPHFVRPIPSMSVAELSSDPENAALITGFPVPRGAVLNSRPIDGLPLRFRTCFDVTLWPIMISGTQWKTPDRLSPAPKSSGATAALRTEIRYAPGVQSDKLNLRSLRLFLNGEAALIHSFYELLCNNTMQILLRDLTPGSRKPPITLPATCLQAVGFHENEALIPYPRRSFEGYRLIQEFFHFPEKFFFIELSGLEELIGSGFKTGFEVVVLISRFERPDRMQQLEVGIGPNSLKLNCTPIINLFKQTAEPILLSHNKAEYGIVPDVRRPLAMEIFSVEEVLSSNPSSGDITYFEPFYSYRHGATREVKQTFWQSMRRQSTRRNDDGTEVSLSLVDLSGRPMRPDFDAITVRTICSNRDLPSRMPIGNDAGDLEPQGLAPIRKVTILRKMTAPVRPPVGKGALWRLISHLSLNYLSLVEDGKESFQEILRLYDFENSPALQKQIIGISSISSQRHFARLVSENGISFARGLKIDIELDEEQFVGAGAYLFASVVERFLALYVTMNSFSQLTVRTKQRKEVLGAWPPRTGQQILL